MSYINRRVLECLYLKTNLKTQKIKILGLSHLGLFSIGIPVLLYHQIQWNWGGLNLGDWWHQYCISRYCRCHCHDYDAWSYFRYHIHRSDIIFDCFLYGYSYRLHCLSQCFLSAYTVLTNEVPVVAVSAVTIAADRTTNTLTSYFVIENWY